MAKTRKWDQTNRINRAIRRNIEIDEEDYRPRYAHVTMAEAKDILAMWGFRIYMRRNHEMKPGMKRFAIFNSQGILCSAHTCSGAVYAARKFVKKEE